MRHAGIDDDGIGRPLSTEREAVRGHDTRLWPVRHQVCPRPGSEHRIDLHRGHRATVADDACENGTVVAGSHADMHHMFARGEIELIIEECHRLGWPARFIDRDQHVVA